MSLSITAAPARMIKEGKVTRDGDDKLLAYVVKMQLKTDVGILAEFHPELRDVLFAKGGGVKFKAMDALGWKGSRRGLELDIRDAPTLAPVIKLTGVDASRFKLRPLEEGGEQLVSLTFKVVITNAGGLVSRLGEYLDEDIFVDIRGGGELDLGPPQDPALDAAGDAARAAITKASDAPTPKAEEIAAVRQLQATKKTMRQKLAAYHDVVLRAAIKAENESGNPKAVLIALIEAELERRLKEAPTGGNA